MIKNLSFITSSLLLSSTLALGADSIDNAFQEGKVSGSLDAYYTTTDADSGDTGFSSAGISLSYETAFINGFSGKVSFISSSDISEENDGDSSDISDNSILSESSITYANDKFGITVGRQEIDLEWMGDFHEAVVASTTVIPNTTLVIGYSDKVAEAGVDKISSEFSKINNSKGAYVIDAKISSIEAIELNPYYYSVPDIADWYGVKAVYSSEMINTLIHYAESSEDTVATDGSMLALELGTEVSGVSLAAGYIATDKNGGIGSMSTVGDNYEPMDDGSAIYEANAKMYYTSIGYSVNSFDLGVAYAQTKIDSNKDKELNLMVDYGFTDSLVGSLLYVDINAQTGATEDQSYITASLNYSF